MVQDAAVREDSAAVAAPADSEEEAVRAEAAAVPAEAEPAGDKRTKENEPPAASFLERKLGKELLDWGFYLERTDEIYMPNEADLFNTQALV